MVQFSGRAISFFLLALVLGSLTLAGCKPDKTAPEDVTNLEASTGDQQVALTWDASANTEGDLAGYKVYQDGVAVGDVGATETGFTASGLANGVSYAFKVTAYDKMPNESAGATVAAYANPPLAAESFTADSGLADGGVGVESTQRMTGTVPNPSGSETEYGGKAYLVINGNRIPLQVTLVPTPEEPPMIEKEGLFYPLVEADWFSPDFDWLAVETAEKAEGSKISIFEVTFSINAGPNALKIEVYDRDGSLFASTETWNVVGTIEPESMVVTLWWDTDKTDIDLHASPDDGETHCYYRDTTAGEMVLDYDDTNGYGPEHITVADATTTATYKIKVYYYADHNEEGEDGEQSTTATTCSVSAQVNGETKLEASSSLSSESTSSGWTSGPHVWDAGEVEVKSANRLNVTMGEPDLDSYPDVSVILTVLNPADGGAGVEDLTEDDIFVINAGTVMRPITVSGGANGVYTVEYTDITAGKRNLFVYVYAPIEGDASAKADAPQEFMGGLSNTVTYGTNYALMVGLNEYPPARVPARNYNDNDVNSDVVEVKPKVPVSAGGVISIGDFSVTLLDETGGTNRPPAPVAATSISSLGGGWFRLELAHPAANPADYDTCDIKYSKQMWLNNCINDIVDLKTVLLNVGTRASSNMWDSANITSITNAAAKEEAVLKAIEDTAALMEPYDVFLFAYSGHGAKGTNSSDQSLCTYEDGKWISVDDLQGKLDLIPDAGVVNTFVIIDACFSGNFAKSDSGPDDTPENSVGAVEKSRPFLGPDEKHSGPGKTFKGLEGGSLFVMTAVDGTHPSWDVNTLGNGAFMYYVVEGMDIAGKNLPTAAANKSRDMWLTGEEVFNYAKPRAKLYVATRIRILPDRADAEEDPQVHPDTNGKSRLLYNW